MSEAPTCLECGRCEKSPNYPEGYCIKYGEFVDGEYTVAELDLDCFEERS